MISTLIVVPCYNEGRRFPTERFLHFMRQAADVGFLFVNDGSRDDTPTILQELQQQAPEQCSVCHLTPNRGKAEAVRQGCLAAFARGVDYVGYWDADLAAPLESLAEFAQVLRERPEVELVCGARVKLLGRSVRRTAVRHYLGRVFATAASWVLGLGVYDTQCGAKLFRASPRMRALFEQPFATRWLLDVEIFARVIGAVPPSERSAVEEMFCEVPLRQWHDQAGSKVKPIDFPKALVELLGIYWKYLRPGARGLASGVATPPTGEELRRAA